MSEFDHDIRNQNGSSDGDDYNRESHIDSQDQYNQGSYNQHFLEKPAQKPSAESYVQDSSAEHYTQDSSTEHYVQDSSNEPFVQKSPTEPFNQQNSHNQMNSHNQYGQQNAYDYNYNQPNQYSPYNQNLNNQNQYGQNQYNPNQYNGQNPYHQGAYYNNDNQYPYGNRNQYGNRNVYQTHQQYKMPEYSFWAEQVPVNANISPVQRTNAWDNNNITQGTDNNKKKEKKQSKGKKALKFIVKAACFGLIAGGGFFGFQTIYYSINPDERSSDLIYNLVDNSKENEEDQGKVYEIGFTKPANVGVEKRSAISDVTAATLPSIVSINSTTTQTTDWFGQRFDQEVEGSGSGIIVGKNENELLIATNNHVVAGASKISVVFKDGSKADAEIKGTDATADLAVVTVDVSTLTQETLNAIAVAKLGDSDDVKVGEMAIAIGNALGYGQSVTVGFISAKDREVEVSDGYNTKKMILLQTDAAINPGNSGGALLSVDGEVIGINTVKYSSYDVEGMGYAIPISRAMPIITEIMNREVLEEHEQGYLAITGNDVTEDVASYYNMPIGVFINEVVEGGPADKAGLKPGDIITKINDIEITAISQLRDYVTSFRVGTKVDVTYMRNTDGKYEEATVTVTLGKKPDLNQSQE